jgi:4-coumarate--CoA ligase
LFGSPTAPLPHEPLFIDTTRPGTHYLSLHSFRAWSARLAVGLRTAGLQRGERVVLFAGNSIFFPVLVMGVVMAGGVCSTANPAFTVRELAFQLQDAGASFVLAARANVERALGAADRARVPRERVFLFEDVSLDGEEDQGDGGREEIEETVVPHWKCLLAPPEIGRDFRWEELRTAEEVGRTVILIYSSGTTGLPKGVELSHRNVVANVCQLFHMQTLDPRFAASKCPKTLGFLPMYHALGLIYYGFVAPKRGLQVYVMERFELFRVVENIQRFRITELLMVPPILIAMAKHPMIREGRHDLSSVIKASCGAAPLGMEAMSLFQELWPEGSIKVRQGWGMSESVVLRVP